MTILWERLDQPGHDWCSLVKVKGGCRIDAVALSAHVSKPARVGYSVLCDSSWQTKKVITRAQIGRKVTRIRLMVNRRKRWWYGGKIC